MKNIRFVKGDLIAAAAAGEVTDVMHGCNCGVIMGGGFAKFISRKYPEVYQADVDMGMKGERRKLGSYSLAKISDGVRQARFNVYNLYTQFNISNDRFYYFAMEKSFRAALKQVIADGAEYSFRPVVGIPLIGAVRGGGDWNQIYHMIVSIVMELDPTGELFDLRIYLLENDPQAWETAFPHRSEYVHINKAGEPQAIMQHVDGLFGMRDVTVHNRFEDPWEAPCVYLPRYEGVIN